ncbi:MAG: helix-turn-helix transcriptional regulator [Bacteroidetes bacterium]|nr:helix-turn-helix transcriptional regulator [Bacteroidota bacterium]MCL6099737.1 helix-turn-helix transcriptional regulator [Bacteroidota bacterium]
MKNILHVLRAEKRLSQDDLAKLLDVSRQTINAIEREKYDPSLPLALKIAKIFEKKVEEIFFPEKEK